MLSEVIASLCISLHTKKYPEMPSCKTYNDQV